MSLNLIIGCMFSGKSTEIIKMINRLKNINQTFLTIKPHIDDRYTTNNMIYTHDSHQRKCIVRKDLVPLFNNKEFQEAKYIIIEESQFFDDLESFVINSVEKYNKHVNVVGLDGDSNRKNFGDIHKLIPICDNIKKLKALCSICKDGTEAIFSKRKCNETTQLCIGSFDKYTAVCRPCYLKEELIVDV